MKLDLSGTTISRTEELQPIFACPLSTFCEVRWNARSRPDDLVRETSILGSERRHRIAKRSDELERNAYRNELRAGSKLQVRSLRSRRRSLS